MTDHALVLVWVSEVGDIVPTGATLVASFVAYLQGGLLGLGRVLLLAVLSSSVPTVLLAVLAMLQSRRVGLENDTVHGTAQSVLCARGDGMDDWRGSNSMLLPGLGHSGP